ncbi:threonine synthase [Haloplanus aerogenes]|uniref:Pyridoxal-phosphate dependent enzyme n=1 Tax=Haloplanus aerogenes TaxID=660522 RepID=A0A3M0DS51_9EURY|nr:pyridoxal-phosphate dependent enzyme [Haloplanus aerogenes]AZH25329.1 pyridoxal-phosphate dependent enzyme [Haloplanus aerogenes]RMB25025.1 threonine synthase [Haloplanus aerogenes]
MTARLRCYRCNETYHPPEQRCVCGEPLWFDVGDGFAPDPDAPGLWRFRDLLPVDDPGGLAHAAGGTPLVRTSRLDDYAGCRVHVKDEGEHPTGSFKDRGTAVGVAAALDRDRPAVGTVSHGNMAMSVAAYAAAADLDCVVLVPADIPPERLRIIAQYDPHVLRIDGDYGRLYDESLAVGAETGVTFLNSDSPLRVAGQKTTTLEVLSAFRPEAPDAIVMPVSSGGHASGAWKAIRDLAACDALPATPKLCFVQSAACDPIAAAFRAGDDAVSPTTPGDTIAYSIANPDPPSGTRALAAARATDGAVVSVTDDEIRDARARLARDAGLCVETASATSLAGARRLAADGVLAPDDRVVLVATGSGFKEASAAASDADPPTVPLADLQGAVAGRL